MSMTERRIPDAFAAATSAAERESAPPPSKQVPKQPPPRFQTPIVPKYTVAGRALVAVVAIMTFLASVTTGGVMLVRAVASDWQAEVAREVTIQVRPGAGRNLDADVARAAEIARGFPGIAEVRPYSKDESTRLLEPWLGSGVAFEDLPVPRLIVVRVATDPAPDLAQLRKLLPEQIPAASLDDHRGFIERMRAMGRAAFLGGLAVLALVLAATVLSVMFATRGAIATNRPVVEVLHLIGATNSYIAKHFERRFLGLGLKGGLIGGGAAIALFALMELGSRSLLGTATGDQFAALFGTFTIGIFGYIAVVLQIVLVALVAAAASRRTVNRTLETIQ
jgi:cell division transport system permease protein